MRINVILENKMAYKEKEIEKLYYSIGEVSEMLSINASTIRYWEKEFDILKPKKNAKGDRFFTKEDIEKIRLIYRMLKEKGYTVDGAKTQLKDKYEEENRKMALIEKLNKIRGFLVEMKSQIEGENSLAQNSQKSAE